MPHRDVTRTISPAREPLNGAALVALLPPAQTPASRADVVCEALRRAILDGVLQPGQPLVERELAEMLGVSKTPVREALKQLRSTGLVEVLSFQGVRVRELDADYVEKLYAARASTEPSAVRLAVLRLGATEHTDAHAALETAAACASRGDRTGMGIANRTFHRLLYTASDNGFLCDFLDQLQDLTAFAATTGWRLRATFEQEAAEHAAILAAVEQGDADLAERLAREHIEKASRTLSETLHEADAGHEG